MIEFLVIDSIPFLTFTNISFTIHKIDLLEHEQFYTKGSFVILHDDLSATVYIRTLCLSIGFCVWSCRSLPPNTLKNEELHCQHVFEVPEFNLRMTWCVRIIYPNVNRQLIKVLIRPHKNWSIISSRLWVTPWRSVIARCRPALTFQPRPDTY